MKQVKVRLLQTHFLDGQKKRIGTAIRLRESTARLLVKAGVARFTDNRKH